MRVLTIGDSPLVCTGPGRVHRHVIDGLVAGGHQVESLGWFSRGPDCLSYNGVPVRGVPKATSVGDTNAAVAVFDAQHDFGADAVVTIGDFWDFYYMQAVKAKADHAFKWMAYLTIESDEIDDHWKMLFEQADAMVVPSEFGRRVLSRVAGRDVSVSPHGTEDLFRRLPDDERAALKRERGCEGKTRFITVAQNTWRKNLPALAQAVSLLAHRDPEKKMQFYVHTNCGGADSQDPRYYDMRAIVDRLGVSEWFSFPTTGPSMYDSPSDEFLLKEYNASDFFVLPSSHEGYGLPLLEAMACGLPGIANATSTIPEHLGAKPDQRFGMARRGFLVSNRVEVCPPNRFLRVVRPDALMQGIWEMHQLSHDPGKRADLEGMRLECQEYAKERTWGRMNQDLCRILDQTASSCSTSL